MIGGNRSASGMEQAYLEAVLVRLGELSDHIATPMSAARVNAPVPPDRPDDTADSDDDNDRLPMYKCDLCNDAVVLSGGGVLKCSTCRS